MNVKTTEGKAEHYSNSRLKFTGTYQARLLVSLALPYTYWMLRFFNFIFSNMFTKP